MNEPNYVYVKGEGWVPYNGPEFVIVNHPEKTFRLEQRRPNPGETYGIFRKTATNAEGKPYVLPDGKVDLQLFKEHIETRQELGLWCWSIHQEGYTLSNEAYYCTFVFDNE